MIVGTWDMITSHLNKIIQYIYRILNRGWHLNLIISAFLSVLTFTSNYIKQPLHTVLRGHYNSSGWFWGSYEL